MTPPHAHIHFDVLVSAGMFARIMVVEPGVQGAGVLGIHGIGVSTPMAAAVAAATVGFAGDRHIPNGMMFTMGTWSMMFAAGWFPTIIIFFGRTTSIPGAIPMLHLSIAELTT